MSKRVETENKREGLAPCPFCSCRDAVLVTSEMDGLPELEADYFVRCNHCFAQGPNRMNESQAIAEWNRNAEQKCRCIKADCDAMDLAKRITVEVKIKHLTKWRWRMQLACWLMSLASWLGCFGEVVFKAEDEQETSQD